MRRVGKYVGILASLVMLLALTSPVALAGNPHFIKNATSDSLSGANLVASFKEAGLPSGATETITLSAHEAVTYECVNGGGHNPSASNKTTFQETESVSGAFTADQNGNIVGSLTLAVPSAASLGFACPPGQTTTFVSVSYTNVSLSDADTGISISLANQSFVNPSAP